MNGELTGEMKMNSKILWVLLTMLLLVACDDPPTGSKPPPKTAADSKPFMTSAEREEKARKITERAGAAMSTLLEAMRIADSEEMLTKLQDRTITCKIDDDDDPKADPKILHDLVTCAAEKLHLAIVSKDANTILGTEKQVERGEELVSLAMKAAKKKAATREAEKQAKADQEQKQFAREKEAADKAIPKCEKDKPGCKAKCESKAEEAGPFCFAWGRVLFQNSDFEAAKAAGERACKLGFKFGCSVKGHVDKVQTDLELQRQRDETKKAEEAAATKSRQAAAFADVSEAVDDIAGKKFMLSNATRLGGRAFSINRMRIVIEASVRERYCPAKKEALASMTLAEFSKMAAAKCKDDPPTGTGLSGSEVPLPNECRQVFASACP